MKAKMMGSGWHKESLRHSQARRFGKAQIRAKKNWLGAWEVSGVDKEGNTIYQKKYLFGFTKRQAIERYKKGLKTERSPYTKAQVQSEDYRAKLYKLPNGKYQYLYPHQAKELIKGGLGDHKPDSAFDKKSLKKGMKVEKEHTNNPLVAKEIAKDHLTEDPHYYEKLEAIEKAPTPPLSKESTSLPIQFSINVPRTYDKDKKLTQKEFDERIKETKKFLSKKFGGDTTIKAKGDYTSDNKLITEDVAIVETSMTRNDYEKNKEKLGRFIKQKRNEWGQETIGYTLEGDFLMYPKF